jgi:hypothetical protein
MRSLENGLLAANLFDDEQRLWDDDRLHKGPSLIAAWKAPRLKSVRRTSGATEVMFNPNAIAVSSSVQDRLRGFPGIEFLPVEIEGEGPFSLVHVTALVDLTPEIRVNRAPPPSGNVVELQEFPAGYAAPGPFFRMRQPPDSAAGRRGYCFDMIYATDEGARALEAACGAYLTLVPWDDKRNSYARIRSSEPVSS